MLKTGRGIAHVRIWVAATLLLACCLYFVVRGPMRAVGSINSYDFASVYGATRSWLHGQDPYDMRNVITAAQAGGDRPETYPHSEPPPSVYLPTFFPVASPIAAMPWRSARLLWMLLSTLAYFGAGACIIREMRLSVAGQLFAGAVLLLFSPPSSGLSTGNPGVLSCALVIISLYLARWNRWLAAAMVLGFAHALKPQLSIAALAVFALWRLWKPFLVSLAVPVVALVISAIPAGSLRAYVGWIGSLQAAIRTTVIAGGLNDPRPANPFAHNLINLQPLLAVWVDNLRALDWLAVTLVIALLIPYLWRRRIESKRSWWHDAAFFSVAVLAVVYHRYYDFALAMPVLVYLRETKRQWQKIGMAVCWAIFELPLQAIFAEKFGNLVPGASVGRMLLLRHESIVLFALCLLLVARSRRAEDRMLSAPERDRATMVPAQIRATEA